MEKGIGFRGILRAIPALIILLAVGIGTAQVLTDSDVRVGIVVARSNMRELAQGLEAYRVDYGLYPYDGYNYVNLTPGDDRYEYWYPPIDLTTPVAYATAAAFEDPFRQVVLTPSWCATFLRYNCIESTWGDDYDAYQPTSGVSANLSLALEEFSEWRLWSGGPDDEPGPTGWPGVTDLPDALKYIPYDPTNGLLSDGDIIHTQANPLGYPYMEFESAVPDNLWRHYQ